MAQESDLERTREALSQDRDSSWSRISPILPSYLAYLAMHVLLSPFLALRGVERAGRRGYRGIVARRLLGGSSPPDTHPRIVIIAGGLGEMRPAGQIASEVRLAKPVEAAILTQQTEASKLGRDDAFVGALPFNNPASVLAFLGRWRPSAILVIEFCDNVHLMFWARALGIPTVILNMPITAEETERVLGKRETWRWRAIGAYAAIGEIHRERLLKLGVAPERIFVSGPIALSIDTGSGATKDWRSELHLDPQDGPVIIAGSTHLEDENVVLAAWEELLQILPKSVLVLAPRDLARSDLTTTLDTKGLSFVRRSEGFEALPSSRIILLDTYGELRDVYQAGTIAFVGGTYGGIGGHTPIEAMAWKLPITLGPRYEQQVSIFETITSEGIAFVCPDAASLAETWIRLASDQTERQRIAERADRLFRENQGQALRVLEGLGLV
jgi:3-deoxy-D-manno-octulosonic-acid transferase